VRAAKYQWGGGKSGGIVSWSRENACGGTGTISTSLGGRGATDKKVRMKRNTRTSHNPFPYMKLNDKTEKDRN